MTTSRSGRSVSWRRIALALALVFGSLAVLELWFGPYFAARSMGTETEMGVVPTLLLDSTVVSTPAFRVQRHGVSFEVPWSETDVSKQSAYTGMATFTNGLGVYVYDPLLQIRRVELVRGLRGLRAAAMRHEIGREALGSEFAFVSAALRTTRSDAKWWRSPFYNIKVEFLLTEKMLETSTPFDRQIPIYEFRFGDIRGFQMGDPQGMQDVVKLVLFDEMDHQYRLDLIHTRTNVSQAEINALVSSLRLEPEKR